MQTFTLDSREGRPNPALRQLEEQTREKLRAVINDFTAKCIENDVEMLSADGCLLDMVMQEMANARVSQVAKLKQNIRDAILAQVWEDTPGLEPVTLTTTCKVNRETGEVFDIDEFAVVGLTKMEREYVVIGIAECPVTAVSERPKGWHGYWYLKSDDADGGNHGQG